MKTINQLTALLKEHSPLKAAHTESVVEIVKKVLKEMNVTSSEKEVVILVAQSHNFGWTKFRKEFCEKTTKYTDREFQLMTIYPQLGAMALSENGHPSEVIEGVRLHASSFDESLPLSARIVRFARDFRKVLEFKTIGDALIEFEGLAGDVYDAKVVAAAKVAFSK
ncbi:HD domain-containing phosphohydrolase [Bacillus cereus group sp. TH152-1LC]|uniref:HD domain-containing phosphohydrolase n=1 Tax=Bacillus cereus group sp. TH152-1LC TaxID=3018060 RepID=UPI0022E16D69|nr:HD domain-containing phosphohydrolase [Bacillus cereus group sp. TH152-1LC]MDA1675498.1 hypothetical protein [Bacillus cereus group sp. TH152-1LC]